MHKIRAFLAAPLPEDLLAQAMRIRDELASALPGVRWVHPETMHLTLKFFGDIPEESLEKIGEVMVSVGGLFSPFELEVAGVGAFPSTARPRVFWLGLKGSEKLAALHASLEEELQKIGIPRDDRPFSPHLTLGRSKRRINAAQNVLEKYQHIVCGSLRVEQMVLFESRLTPSGAVHLPLKTVLLA